VGVSQAAARPRPGRGVDDQEPKSARAARPGAPAPRG
jgi:hypothetical protein